MPAVKIIICTAGVLFNIDARVLVEAGTSLIKDLVYTCIYYV